MLLVIVQAARTSCAVRQVSGRVAVLRSERPVPSGVVLPSCVVWGDDAEKCNNKSCGDRLGCYVAFLNEIKMDCDTRMSDLAGACGATDYENTCGEHYPCYCVGPFWFRPPQCNCDDVEPHWKGAVKPLTAGC